jgi:hypothetical protein
MWRQRGKKPEEFPQQVEEKDLKDGNCPTCGAHFENYFPF